MCGWCPAGSPGPDRGTADEDEDDDDGCRETELGNRLRFLLRGVRLMQFLLIVTSHSPLFRSELLHSARAAATVAALCWMSLSPVCCMEKCSGTILRDGLDVGGGGGGGAELGEGFSPS